MVNDWLWHHPERFNICHTSFTQRITLHLSEERQAKNKMQKHKDILVAVPKSAVPKSIYNNLLYMIAIGQTVQSSAKPPLHMNP
jgi:predicted SpoU family rRNA methylase